MSEPQDQDGTRASVSLYDRNPDAQGSPVGILGFGLALLWLALCGAYALVRGETLTGNPTGLITLAMLIVGPLALLWIGIISVQTARRVSRESERLSAAVDSLRQAYVSQAQQARSEQLNPTLLKRLDGLSTGQKHLEKTMAMLATGHLTSQITGQIADQDSTQSTGARTTAKPGVQPKAGENAASGATPNDPAALPGAPSSGGAPLASPSVPTAKPRRAIKTIKSAAAEAVERAKAREAATGEASTSIAADVDKQDKAKVTTSGSDTNSDPQEQSVDADIALAEPDTVSETVEKPALTQASTEKPEPLSRKDFVRALHFPETAEDTEGFAALRRAMRDPEAALLLRAAQDVLTLLSQSGIYMDDLAQTPARPDVWRAFSRGTRGTAVIALGGIRDREALAKVSNRLEEDTIFRDTVQHFLRRFDNALGGFVAKADGDDGDEALVAFGKTRSARAFMLLGRVAKTFDT